MRRMLRWVRAPWCTLIQCTRRRRSGWCDHDDLVGAHAQALRTCHDAAPQLFSSPQALVDALIRELTDGPVAPASLRCAVALAAQQTAGSLGGGAAADSFAKHRRPSLARAVAEASVVEARM